MEKREELVLEKWSMLSDGKGLFITNNGTLKLYEMGSYSIEEGEPQDFPGEVSAAFPKATQNALSGSPLGSSIAC